MIFHQQYKNTYSFNSSCFLPLNQTIKPLIYFQWDEDDELVSEENKLETEMYMATNSLAQYIVIDYKVKWCCKMVEERKREEKLLKDPL